jgi:hypothetical protein
MKRTSVPIAEDHRLTLPRAVWSVTVEERLVQGVVVVIGSDSRPASMTNVL